MQSASDESMEITRRLTCVHSGGHHTIPIKNEKKRESREAENLKKNANSQSRHNFIYKHQSATCFGYIYPASG